MILLMILLLIVFFEAIIYVNYIVAKKFEEIAIQKGYDSEIHSFAMCFWLGIVGYLYVIALPDLKTQSTTVSEASNSQKATTEIKSEYHCPYCRKAIPFGVSHCPSCNLKVNWKNN